jgi:hypothetical protein
VIEKVREGRRARKEGTKVLASFLRPSRSKYDSTDNASFVAWIEILDGGVSTVIGLSRVRGFEIPPNLWRQKYSKP